MKNNNNFKILPGSQETHIKDFSHLNNEDIVKSVFMNGDICLPGGNNKNQKIITLNDTFNTRGLNNDEIIEVFKNRIGINILKEELIEEKNIRIKKLIDDIKNLVNETTNFEVDLDKLQGTIKFKNQEIIKIKKDIKKLNKEKGLKELNILFIDSIDFLNNVLYRNIGNKIKQNKCNYFSNHLNVINFLRETEKGQKSSQTNCRIAKIIYGVNDILENPEIVESENNAKSIIKNKISPLLLKKEFNSLMNYNQSKCSIKLNGKKIYFKLKFRGKKSSSALLKIIYNPEYHTSNLMKDPIGMELVCESEDDIVLLLSHFYTTLFGEKIENIKPKGFDIQELSKTNGINGKFKKILENIDIEKKDKSNTHEGYMDLKILGKIDGFSVEFRGSLEGNKEEDILKSDPIYYLGKIILASIRLDGYITENYIKLIINNFFEKNSDMVKKIDKNHLLDYLIKNLIQIDRGNKCNIYTSNDRYDILSDTEFYPENFKKIEK